LVHETRFRRLLRCPDRETLYPQLARLLRLLDRPVDLVDLAESVSRWNDQARRRWAYDYFATANPKS
jgi:CRISPR type I-E-associated protein CasB/Cse2